MTEQRAHVLLCRADDEKSGWILAIRHRGVWSMGDEFRHFGNAYTRLLDTIGEWQDKADVTFTTRTQFSVAATSVVEDASELASALPGASIIAMLPARETGDLWVQLWRDHAGGLSGGEIETRFRLATLRDRVVEYFQAEDIRSFSPPNAVEAHSVAAGMPGVHRVAHNRELWIRRSWRASDLVPMQVKGIMHLQRTRELDEAMRKAIRDKRNRARRAKLHSIRTG